MSAPAKAKKIAIVVDTLNGGGAEKVCLVLARALLQLGARVQLIVMKKHCDYEIDSTLDVTFIFSSENIKLYHARTQKTAANKLKEIAHQAGGFDLVLSNLDGSHPIVNRADLNNTWYVVHNSVEEKLKRAWRLGPLKYWRQKKVYRCFNNERLIAVSEGLKNELCQSKKVQPKEVRRIYNPLDVESLSTSASKTSPLTFPYIIHVGRFARMKRHDVLFEALKSVSEDVTLVLLCENSKKLQAAIAKAGVTERVVLAGFQQNPYPWIRHAQALVLSSEAEGFGMVLAEALYCGTPVVSSDCRHGPREILSGGWADYLVPVGDAAALAQAITRALRESPHHPAPIINQMAPVYVARQYLQLA